MKSLLIYVINSLLITIVANKLSLEWYAPFFSGGGYCSEAISVAQSLRIKPADHFDLSIFQHGDSINEKFLLGLSSTEQNLFADFSSLRGHTSKSIAVCHSEPGAWHAPMPHYHTVRCPPVNAIYSIGRTMFETDRIPEGWVPRLNFMHEIWVPTTFAKEIFLRAGVAAHKIFIVGEAVDVAFYKPPAYSNNYSVCSTCVSRALLREYAHVARAVEGLADDALVYLFVGKWESRKGIKILIEAYGRAFASDDNVRLILVTSVYHSSDRFEEGVREAIGQAGLDASTFPSYVVLNSVPQILMPVLYAAANVLVMPSHGEGWGRPHIEAMACGTPVIATNWSGPTEYLTPFNGYPLAVLGLVEADGWKGHRWAEPSVNHLIELLQAVARDPQAAAARGVRARADVVEKYSLLALRDVLLKQFERIRDLLETSNISRSLSAGEL